MAELSDFFGGSVQLAPDLTYPADKNPIPANKVITGIDGSSGFTPALSLTGRFVINQLSFSDMAIEVMSVRMTVDGVIIWNDSFTPGGTKYSLFNDYGSAAAIETGSEPGFTCNQSMLLEIQTTADTDVTLTYIARPIL